ncbi:serine hydrolase domain-containing protein [uncultured Meiothermus sp.]|jgi:CubicO group peptidase (beta-lactamase class C family)|uniref:serine hydrolase domain-containing protein n=1 Tax=uncultured Meiothermus sp. TaxID=157471 RepID=UPI002606EFBF|nr:serine hydrolase domain-containing protein [uncultured Meiothermus sp.]
MTDLEHKLSELMARYRVPGVAVGILQDGVETYVCEGVTNVFDPLEVTRDTLFQVASNTKTMTGTLAMRLVEEGKLELDKPVINYLPELKLADPQVAQTATMRHLFNHTGGWVGDLFGNTGDGDDALQKYVAGVDKMPQITPLGSLWHYNNAGFGIAGRVIEVLTGKTFEQVARDMLFEPLGMERSSFFPHEAILHRHCVGHFLDECEQFRISKPWAFARAVGPIGRVNSTVCEMLRYARVHLEGGLGVISPESVQAMQQVTAKGQLDDDFGVTWWMRDLLDKDGNRIRAILHGGAANGQMSAFWLVPSRNFACVILTNAQKGGFLHGELNAWINEQYLDLKAPEPKAVNASEQELRVYVGKYVGHAFGTTVEVYLDEGSLWHRILPGDVSSVTTTPPPPLPPARLELLENERLHITEGDGKGGKLEILRDTAGQMVWLRTGGRLYAQR